jgi:putative Holliday junction resolvase
MARIMAIDYGRKRCGIAVTDPLQIIANSLTTVDTKDLLTFILDYVKKENVETIVIGEPKDMQNNPSESSRYIEPFIGQLRKALPEMDIKRHDERFTSKMAFQTMIEKNKGRQNFAPTNTMAGDIKIEMEKVEREVLGTTIAEAEVGKTATVDEALASGPSTEEQLQALNDEAKTIISTFTPAQKEELKAGLTAKGFKTVSRAAIKTVEEMTTYLEVVKSIKDK